MSSAKATFPASLGRYEDIVEGEGDEVVGMPLTSANPELMLKEDGSAGVGPSAGTPGK